MKRFKGFTLTELMVALAVIGILVAVVTPAIMKTRPNKNKMMVKKTFYTTEQIVSSLINDERLYPDMRDACAEGFVSGTADVYCAYGFDYTESVKYEGKNYSGDKKFAELFKNRLNVKKESAGDALVFYTTDGVKWDLNGVKGAWPKGDAPGEFDGNNAPTNTGTILIDVDGDAGVNKREADSDEDSFDQYKIQILSNGKLRIDPADSRAVDYATINTSIRDTVDEDTTEDTDEDTDKDEDED